jgi:REP element-mobilizing transposase RayT
MLSKLVGRLKMQSAKEINIIENRKGEKFWQNNYYDRIIRNNNEYEKIKTYIYENPKKWENERNNVENLFM